MKIVAASVNGKYYPQFFLQDARISYKNVAIPKIYVSEGIDTNKTSALKECMLCHYCCFKDVGFKFERHVCNKCHDVLKTAYELKKHCNIKCKRS